MKINRAFVFVGIFLPVGCAASADGPGGSEHTSTSAQALTLTQCASQRDACLTSNPLFGWFTCPAQYALCTATASNGLPAQVNQAISDAASCTGADLECTNAANTPAALAACATTDAECVASIVQAQLPSIVTGTATCVTDAVKCINAAELVTDLTTCANNLQSCAVTQVQMVVPPQVGQVIGTVNSCETTLNNCISAAATPAAVTKCSQTGATCVAGGLGVTLPDVTVPAVVQCAETAAKCALAASSIDDLTGCTSNLNICNANAVGQDGAPPVLTCAQKWTACLAKNPLNFLACDVQLLGCTN
jgi:hypothetical protein